MSTHDKVRHTAPAREPHRTGRTRKHSMNTQATHANTAMHTPAIVNPTINRAFYLHPTHQLRVCLWGLTFLP